MNMSECNLCDFSNRQNIKIMNSAIDKKLSEKVKSSSKHRRNRSIFASTYDQPQVNEDEKMTKDVLDTLQRIK